MSEVSLVQGMNPAPWTRLICLEWTPDSRTVSCQHTVGGMERLDDDGLNSDRLHSQIFSLRDEQTAEEEKRGVW